MYIFNISEPFTLLLMLAVSILMIFLAKETKKSIVTAISLFLFLILLVMHVVQFISMTPTLAEEYKDILTKCLALDFMFVLIGFISYLWIDDIETKLKKKKSIDNSLDWFWRKV